MSRQQTEAHLRNIFHSTKGIIFLGTPHHGAGLAKWAKVVVRFIGLVKHTNPEIVNVLRYDSEVLSRIRHGFYTVIKARTEVEPPPIEIACFYEEVPVIGVGLVGHANPGPHLHTNTK